ncbi:MAG: hypothetical protein WAM94_20400 [Chromatiaceae bacterium]
MPTLIDIPVDPIALRVTAIAWPRYRLAALRSRADDAGHSRTAAERTRHLPAAPADLA